MKGRRLFKIAMIPLILLAPAVLLRFFTFIYPLFKTIYLSFRDYDITRGTNAFAGFENFIRIAKDVTLQKSISFTIIFVIFATFGEIILGLIVAFMLNIKFRFQRFARIIVLIPWAIAPIAAALIFRWLLNPDYSIIGNLLPPTIFNMVSLSSPLGAKIAVILAATWKNTPFIALILLAGMQGIPAELYEAAKIDGASQFQVIRFISIPLIKPMIISTTILFFIWQLATFDLIYGMTMGGPGYSTSVLSYKMFREAFSGLNFGYASAIGVVLFLVTVFVGIIGFIYWRKNEFTL